jgi:hypothetical protein
VEEHWNPRNVNPINNIPHTNSFDFCILTPFYLWMIKVVIVFILDEISVSKIQLLFLNRQIKLKYGQLL